MATEPRSGHATEALSVQRTILYRSRREVGARSGYTRTAPLVRTVCQRGATPDLAKRDEVNLEGLRGSVADQPRPTPSASATRLM
jgi:hypothetical protein